MIRIELTGLNNKEYAKLNTELQHKIKKNFRKSDNSWILRKGKHIDLNDLIEEIKLNQKQNSKLESIRKVIFDRYYNTVSNAIALKDYKKTFIEANEAIVEILKLTETEIIK